jgi:hypothetical protein
MADRDRQHCCRRAYREREELLLVEAGEAALDATANEVVNARVASAVAKRIARVIAQELREHCTRPRNREAVMEWLLGNPLVYPHLPDYYLKPKEAKIYVRLVTNLRAELQEVKGVHSSQELAYEGALLNAVVRDGIDNRLASGHSPILNTNPHTLRNAVQCQSGLLSTRVSLWQLPKHRQRSDVLNPITSGLVVDWWTTETRVSPRNKDVANKWIAPKVYKKHTTYFLTEL